MRTLFIFLALIPIIASCSSKNPRGFVGVWYAEIPGLFDSTEMLIRLDADGRCRLGTDDRKKNTWTVEDDVLKIKSATGTSDLPILARTDEMMTLKFPDPQGIVHFNRIGE
jgi:hypothetical protein